MEPELTVLVFRWRGWSAADYDAWSERLIGTGAAFVMATRVGGEPAARIVIVNPRTTLADVEMVLDAMAGEVRPAHSAAAVAVPVSTAKARD